MKWMIVVWHKVRSFFGDMKTKKKLENPIITYFTTVCRCGCAPRKNEMVRLRSVRIRNFCGSAPTARRKNQPKYSEVCPGITLIFFSLHSYDSLCQRGSELVLVIRPSQLYWKLGLNLRILLGM